MCEWEAFGKQDKDQSVAKTRSPRGNVDGLVELQHSIRGGA
jgi:hypothetical protein